MYHLIEFKIRSSSLSWDLDILFPLIVLQEGSSLCHHYICLCNLYTCFMWVVFNSGMHFLLCIMVKSLSWGTWLVGTERWESADWKGCVRETVESSDMALPHVCLQTRFCLVSSLNYVNMGSAASVESLCACGVYSGPREANPEPWLCKVRYILSSDCLLTGSCCMAQDPKLSVTSLLLRQFLRPGIHAPQSLTWLYSVFHFWWDGFFKVVSVSGGKPAQWSSGINENR